jgi:hypothetical protein
MTQSKSLSFWQTTHLRSLIRRRSRYLRSGVRRMCDVKVGYVEMQ